MLLWLILGVSIKQEKKQRFPLFLKRSKRGNWVVIERPPKKGGGGDRWEK